MIMVVLDSREPKHVKELFTEYFPEGETGQENAGDLNDHIKGIGIERKVNTDMVGSVLGNKEEDGRIWQQCYKLSQTFQHCYIILIGGYDDLPDEYKAKFSYKMWRGIKISLMTRYGIRFLTVANNREFFEVSKLIFEKSDGDLKMDRVVRIKRTKDDQLAGCLMQINGVGLENARNIIDTFKPDGLMQICKLGVEDLMTVPKIGKVKATKIKELFK